MNMLDKIDLETSHLSDEALKAHIKILLEFTANECIISTCQHLPNLRV